MCWVGWKDVLCLVWVLSQLGRLRDVSCYVSVCWVRWKDLRVSRVMRVFGQVERRGRITCLCVLGQVERREVVTYCLSMCARRVRRESVVCACWVSKVERCEGVTWGEWGLGGGGGGGSGGKTRVCHVSCVYWVRRKDVGMSRGVCVGSDRKTWGGGGGRVLVFVSVERCSVVTYCVSSQVERRADVMCCLYWVRWKDVGMRAWLAWVQWSVLPVGAPGQGLVADGASQMRSERQYAGFHPQ